MSIGEVPSAFITYTPNGPPKVGENRAKAIFWPSGDQTGSPAKSGTDVSCVNPVPSALTVNICTCRTNVILLPSGDQDGDASAPLVTRLAPEPSAFMT